MAGNVRDSVPDSPLWRWPEGRWRQAPPEYGGKWWYINPFTGTSMSREEPWLIAGEKPKPIDLPAGFIDVFGLEPKPEDFNRPPVPGELMPIFDWSGARAKWLKDLSLWREGGSGVLPTWAVESDVRRVLEFQERFGVPAPMFFRLLQDPDKVVHYADNEWQAIIVVPGRARAVAFIAPASLILRQMGLGVSEYQMHALSLGVDPSGGIETRRHPMVPMQLWPDYVETDTGGHHN